MVANKDTRKWGAGSQTLGIFAVFAVTLGLAIFTVIVATRTPPNVFAAGLLQAMTLVLTVVASIYAGHQAASKAAQESIRPHARSAFRRALTLKKASLHLVDSIEDYAGALEAVTGQTDGKVEMLHVHFAFDALKSQVVAQGGTLDDAMWDWRDVLPEVAQIMQSDQASPPEVNL